MDSQSRFAHLLKPIRELTKNWDIDVASELNDYLEELDEMCITFDGGKIQLNFAEAALLIQGSTCIYSKKVELLYNLVYQTLGLINDRNKKRDKQSAESEGDGAGRTVTDHDTDDASFRSYDDSVSKRSPLYTESNTCVSVAPLPPESLILPEASEKQKLPLISLKGEALGSCKDFRMNTFTADALGLIHLVLEGCSQSNNSMAPVSLYHDQDGADQAGGGAAVGVPEDGGGGDGGDDFLPLEDNGMETEQGEEEHIDRHQAPSEGRVLRERRDVQPSEEEDLKQRREEEEKAHAARMWGLHDDTATFGKDIPLKTGKCYRVPDGLDGAGKRKRKESSVHPDFGSWLTGIYDPPVCKLKNGPDFPDLNYIYLSKVKEKLRTRRRILRKKGVVVSDEELRRTCLQMEEGREEEEEEQPPPEGLRLPNLQDADHSDEDEHEALPEDVPAEFGGGQDFMLPDAELEHLNYEDLVRKALDQLLVNSQRYGQETALSLRVRDWEEKIRPELAMQEERPTFDIHDYGDRIVAALGDVGHRRSFASIVHNMDNFEACKYMLASLQLANDYTVEVDQAEGLEESVDTMALTLLGTHRAADRFKTLPTS